MYICHCDFMRTFGQVTSRRIFSAMSRIQEAFCVCSWSVSKYINLYVGLTTFIMSSSHQETFVLYRAPYGALTQLWAGTMPDALNHNGEVSQEVQNVQGLCSCGFSFLYHGHELADAGKKLMIPWQASDYGIGYKRKYNLGEHEMDDAISACFNTVLTQLVRGITCFMQRERSMCDGRKRERRCMTRQPPIRSCILFPRSVRN